MVFLGCHVQQPLSKLPWWRIDNELDNLKKDELSKKWEL